MSSNPTPSLTTQETEAPQSSPSINLSNQAPRLQEDVLTHVKWYKRQVWIFTGVGVIIFLLGLLVVIRWQLNRPEKLYTRNEAKIAAAAQSAEAGVEINKHTIDSSLSKFAEEAPEDRGKTTTSGKYNDAFFETHPIANFSPIVEQVDAKGKLTAVTNWVDVNNCVAISQDSGDGFFSPRNHGRNMRCRYVSSRIYHWSGSEARFQQVIDNVVANQKQSNGWQMYETGFIDPVELSYTNINQQIVIEENFTKSPPDNIHYDHVGGKINWKKTLKEDPAPDIQSILNTYPSTSKYIRLVIIDFYYTFYNSKNF